MWKDFKGIVHTVTKMKEQEYCATAAMNTKIDGQTQKIDSHI